jgi:hypothetical protein
MAKPKTKRGKKPKCSGKHPIKFETKRGKTISFRGRTGAGCPPRKKPSTRHLRAWKEVMAKASPQCKRASKGNVKAFRACVGEALDSVKG